MMSKYVSIALLALGLLATLIFLGVNRPAPSIDEKTAAAPEQERTRDPGTNSTTESVGSEPQGTSSSAARTMATSANASNSATSTAARSGPAPLGPAPLTAENEQRLLAFVEERAMEDAQLRDYLTRIATEERDKEWADAVEGQLQISIREKGAGFTALQVGTPTCTLTVCMLQATGGLSTGAANADWQTLINSVASEPWFQQNFGDIRTTITGDLNGILYLTYLVRKS